MKINKELMKGSTTMLVLQLLSQESMYGYQMVKVLEEQSENTFTLKEGTLYPILHGLEAQGFIQSYWEETDSARKRKYYAITPAGEKHLEERRQEWQLYCRGINLVIGGTCHESGN